MTNLWTSFRSSYPDRCFHLLEPYRNPKYNTYSYPAGSASALHIPPEFINEISAGTTFWSRVSRTTDGYTSGIGQYGSLASTSDWWDLIGASVLPSGAKIGLCIDNSGSMTTSTVTASLNLFRQNAAAAGVTIVAPSGGAATHYCDGMIDEDWIIGLTVDIN